MKNSILKTISCLHDFSEQGLQLFHFIITIFRSSLPEMFCKKGVLRNFAKFTGKYLFQYLFFKWALIHYQICIDRICLRTVCLQEKLNHLFHLLTLLKMIIKLLFNVYSYFIKPQRQREIKKLHIFKGKFINIFSNSCIYHRRGKNWAIKRELRRRRY